MRDLFLRSRRSTFFWEPSCSQVLEDFDRKTIDELKMVAMEDGRVTGFVSIHEPDNFIHHLHVDPMFPRRGIGRALLRSLPDWPSTRYRLKCVLLNAPALAFYKANRFSEVGRGHADGQEYVVLESSGGQ